MLKYFDLNIYSQTCELYYNILNDNKITHYSSRDKWVY